MASERALQFDFGWFANPVVHGDYPDVMKRQVARKSKAQHFNESRLPAFTEEEKNMIKGTYYDWFNVVYSIIFLP